MTDKVAELLLQEFRAFRDTEFREFKDDVANWKQDSGERLSTLEVSVKVGITGNGQPSRLAVLEREVEELQHDRWKFTGILIAAGSCASFLLHLLPFPWGHK